MTEQEKETYSLIFKFVLKMSKDKDMARFAKQMLEDVIDTEPDNNTFASSWDLLKEYVDITTDDESRWKDVVDKADELGRTTKFARKMVTTILFELERRARNRNAE
jgi:predicted outer membrane protein